MESLTVVIRSVGERTTAICEQKAKAQADDVTVINVNPFIMAVKKTLELARDSKNEWTLALDADVQLNDNGIYTILNEAHRLLYNQSELVRIDFPVQDKFRGRTYAGCHLYRNKYASKILEQMYFNYDPLIKRPESRLIQEFKKKNRLQSKDAKIRPVGLHDFEQSYQHLYNKYLNRGYKDSEYCQNMMLTVKQKQVGNPTDLDFEVVIQGLKDSSNMTGMLTDSNHYRSIKELLERLNIQEKNPL